MGYVTSSELIQSDLSVDVQVYLLVEIVFAGKTFRWSTKPVSISKADGEILHFDGGLNELQFEVVLQTLADTPDQTSISLDLLWPVDVALLVSQGHDLSSARGSMAAWVDGKTYEQRQVLIDGRIRQPQYGNYNDPVSLTIEEAPFEDAGQWPDSSHRVSDVTWPTHRIEESGRPYQQVIGRPGTRKTPNGGTILDVGTRAQVVETLSTDDTQAITLMIAGHKVESTTVRIYYVGAEGWSPDEGFIDFAGAGSVDYDGPVEYIQDGLGQYCSIVRIGTVVVPEIRKSVEFQVYWNRGVNGLNGGLVTADPTDAIRGAGDVMEYVLQRSTLRVDWGRFNAVRQRMNAWLLDFYVNENVEPWTWITDNLLPLMPISMHSGPSGLYPVFWLWNASKEQAVDRIVFGPGTVRVSGVDYQKQPGDIRNRISMRYAWETTLADYFRTVIHTPDPDLTDREQVTSTFSKRSALTYGMTSEQIFESSIVSDDVTAQKSVNWRILAEGFSHRSVSYEVGQEYAYLDLGAVVLLTDSELYFDELVALVQGNQMTDTGRIKITLQIVENVARSRKTTGPNPDQGIADPGDYQ